MYPAPPVTRARMSGKAVGRKTGEARIGVPCRAAAQARCRPHRRPGRDGRYDTAQKKPPRNSGGSSGDEGLGAVRFALGDFEKPLFAALPRVDHKEGFPKFRVTDEIETHVGAIKRAATERARRLGFGEQIEIHELGFPPETRKQV